MGWRWFLWRGLYAFSLRTGLMGWWTRRGLVGLEARTRRVLQDDDVGDLHSRIRPLFPDTPTALESGSDGGDPREACLRRADTLVAGRLTVFGKPVDIRADMDWFAGESGHWPADRPWYRIPDLAPELGDIKYVWEKSRFTWAFALGQAYRWSGREIYAETFWRHWEDWQARNPHGLGPNWRCGQEVAMRSLALCYVLNFLSRAEASTDERLAGLIRGLARHAHFITRVHWYARHCVRNNHAITEAVALLSVARVCPFLPDAYRWHTQGSQALDRELAWQIYADGTYVQQSHNYSRLVAQLLTWVLAMGKAEAGLPLDLAPIRRQGEALLEHLLCQLQGTCGRLPNFGSNDGALLLPWSDCGFRDYRPALHALSLAVGRGGLAGRGPWREEAWWLGLERGKVGGGPDGPVPGPRLHEFPDGGLQILKMGSQMALFRCGPNRNRPIQADMMHVDYWWAGHNLLMDPGTYKYNTDRAHRDYFSGARGHNTITLDGRDPMVRGGRFLWLDWTQGRITDREVSKDCLQVTGEHQGFGTHTHQRRIRMTAQGLEIIDSIVGDPVVEVRLHWLARAEGFTLEGSRGEFQLPGGRMAAFTVACDHEFQVEAWRDAREIPAGVISEIYGDLSEAVSVVAKARGKVLEYRTRVVLRDPQDRGRNA